MPLPTATVHALVTGDVYDPFSFLGLHHEGHDLVPECIFQTWKQ